MNRMTTAMARAAALTRGGKLREATEVVQALLRAGAESPEHSPNSLVNINPSRNAEYAPALHSLKGAAGASRTGLAATLSRIAAGGMPGPATLSQTPCILPSGAQFLSLSHSSRHGTRDYRLYIPANHRDEPMPLIVMLHGCTQTPEDFANGTGMNELAETRGYLIAYPAQPSGANAQKCWNWFRPEDQVRERGEPALIAGIVQDILRDRGGDPARTYIAGLSAGGAAAALMADAYPDVFSAVGIHSGLPIGAARDVPSAFAAMRSGAVAMPRRNAVPSIVFHGTADHTVHPENGRAIIAQALRSYPPLQKSCESAVAAGGAAYRRTRYLREDQSLVELWEVEGAGHAWSGGRMAGSYADPKGPDASGEMLKFFGQFARH